MTGEELREAIRALLADHPAISISSKGHATHAERYVATNGAPLGFEPARVRHQNLWVRADSVRVNRLSDIDSEPYDHSTFAESKPNHNLFGEAAFKDADLICFKVTDLWQAVRIVAEVAGLKGSP
ncbi:hypothetical protein [Mesorhizobium sp. 131-2-1]|uniref:hypothetical protein n=1 Tax=Mesorhizobium sp. 131-2-1 TaxID=2744518 RepID=UPI0019286C84|nr:hypothetical protein [Mesorhizobium sp. 131-2-1]BCG95986.1 hypothetical protein MesoLj131a_48500 [Mesorhizobium sp. 131-2-1]